MNSSGERKVSPGGGDGGGGEEGGGGAGAGGRERVGGFSDDYEPSLDVARGPATVADAMERRDALRRDRISRMKEGERGRMEAYLSGWPNADARKRRREALREDDAADAAAADAADGADGKTPADKRMAAQRRQRRRAKDKVLEARMEALETKRMEAAVAATDAELILNTEQSGLIETETDMERTYKLSQAELRRDHLDEQTARHIFDLKLDEYGPYGCRYDRSGRRGLLLGGKGHVALMDCHTLALKTEFYVNETVRDGVFLHNNTMFAVAQRRNAFIYDDTGTEIHRMDDHEDVHRMEFLPYHWLLATVGRQGWLKYHDTSTGTLISRHRTKLGPCSVMAQNPYNAVIHLGHGNGSVTLWSPASSDYLVKMLCHRGSPVTSVAVDRNGRYMATGGADSRVRVWDLRMYEEVHSYFTMGGPPTSIDISQRGVLGIGHGCHTTFWGPDALKVKAKDPYMYHRLPGCGPIETLNFRPYEDVCGIGHQGGISSIVIPGSGEPNLDSMEYNTNPYQDKKQRGEAEVRALLDKLSPDMIALDPDVIGTVELSDSRRRAERARDMEADRKRRQEEEERKPKKREKRRARGRSKVGKKLARKQKNVVDAQTVKLREMRERELEERKRKNAKKKKEGRERVGGKGGGGDNVSGGGMSAKEEAPQALKRFFK